MLNSCVHSLLRSLTYSSSPPATSPSAHAPHPAPNTLAPLLAVADPLAAVALCDEDVSDPDPDPDPELEPCDPVPCAPAPPSVVPDGALVTPAEPEVATFVLSEPAPLLVVAVAWPPEPVAVGLGCASAVVVWEGAPPPPPHEPPSTPIVVQ